MNQTSPRKPLQSLIRRQLPAVDRTPYIAKLEKEGDPFVICLRPSHFGREEFLRMLHCYYGIEYRTAFQQIFKHLYISRYRTASANKYHILRFDFSRIDSNTLQLTRKDYLNEVLQGITHFRSLYGDRSPGDGWAESGCESALDVLPRFLQQNHNRRLFVIINEHDHFLEGSFGPHRQSYRSLCFRNQAIESFYRYLKHAIGKGEVERVFIMATDKSESR